MTLKYQMNFCHSSPAKLIVKSPLTINGMIIFSKQSRTLFSEYHKRFMSNNSDDIKHNINKNFTRKSLNSSQEIFKSKMVSKNL